MSGYPLPARRLTLVRAPSALLPFGFALFASLMAWASGAYWLTAIGLGACAYFFVRLLQEAGKDLPIESFVLVVASVQWILGPTLTYAGLSDHWKYLMYVPEPEYMALAVPGVIAMGLGLYSFRARGRARLVANLGEVTREIVWRTPQLPYYLIGVGVGTSFLINRFPPSLAFVAYLLSNIKYIGLIYLIYSERHRRKTAILLVAFLLAFASSLRAAMFHDLLLWSAFVGMYAAHVLRPTIPKKLLAVALSLVAIFVLQAAKDRYREQVIREGHRDHFSQFVISVDERLGADPRAEGSNVERLVVRINQGWIISRIMERVPDVVPHASGETVVTAVKASLLPRVLFPDKPMAGGRANYEKYTGFVLTSTTSMGISLLGEGYVNYGFAGAWVFLFGFGLTASLVIHWIFRLCRRYPTLWLWFPLVLLHFVKAETELLVQLNFLVKSLVLVLLFVWFNKRLLRLRF